MTALLKRAAAGGGKVRSVRAFGSGGSAGPDDPGDPLRTQLLEALAALAVAEARVTELEAECVRARQEGEDAGRAIGLAEADDRADETLKLLAKGVAAAQERFETELRATERLAALLARESVAIMIGDSARHAELVERALRVQMKALEAGSIVEVSVSPLNFGDPAALETLAVPAGARIAADPALESGQCRIRLRLGSIDAGPVQQWARLAATLDELAGEPS